MTERMKICTDGMKSSHGSQCRTSDGCDRNDHFQLNQEDVTDASLTGIMPIVAFATDEARYNPHCPHLVL